MQELDRLDTECCRLAKEVTEEDSDDDDDGLDTSDDEGRGRGSLTLE